MTKRIKKLERENLQYKNKWESCNRALLEMVDLKTKQEAVISNQVEYMWTLSGY